MTEEEMISAGMKLNTRGWWAIDFDGTTVWGKKADEDDRDEEEEEECDTEEEEIA